MPSHSTENNYVTLFRCFANNQVFGATYMHVCCLKSQVLFSFFLSLSLSLDVPLFCSRSRLFVLFVSLLSTTLCYCSLQCALFVVLSCNLPAIAITPFSFCRCNKLNISMDRERTGLCCNNDRGETF